MSDKPSSFTPRGKKIALIVLVGLAFLVADAALIIGLRNNIKRQEEIDRRQRAAKAKQGTHLPPLSGQDIYGNRLSLPYGDSAKKTLLLVFSPRCVFCTENMPVWKKISAGLDEKTFRTVGVTTLVEGTRDYMARHELSRIPVLAAPDKEVEDAYSFKRTPQTILINSDGVVERVWLGVIGEDQYSEIEQALGVRLHS